MSWPEAICLCPFSFTNQEGVSYEKKATATSAAWNRLWADSTGPMHGITDSEAKRALSSANVMHVRTKLGSAVGSDLPYVAWNPKTKNH